MAKKYIIGIDQSTQGTKALLFDEIGSLIKRYDLPHEQKISKEGWVSHDPSEIYKNTVAVIDGLLKEAGVPSSEIEAMGISNQRETTVIWDRVTGEPLADAIVWQCARAAEICERENIKSAAELVMQHTGIRLSPYFPAAKAAWFMENVPGAKEKAKKGELCIGTVDSWLIFKLTGGKEFKTDYSNASRTQLFNIFELKWDEEICGLFGIEVSSLPKVCFSDERFGETTAEGIFETPIPIHAAIGDSHGALLGQGCLKPGMIKATYGTGSSIMMNIGETPVLSTHGVVTSVAFSRNGRVNYCLEGNINYTGAVISWLKDDVRLIESAGETEGLCREAEQDDELYLVPAFTGLGAPHWKSHAKGILSGITRTTGKAEIVRAGVEAIAYQITDVIKAMEQDADMKVKELSVDGGPTKNKYLMQFQSDIAGIDVLVPDAEEFSGIGAAYAAGIAAGLYTDEVFDLYTRKRFAPEMERGLADKKYDGWLKAVEGV
ncbi:MAG: glycerol kinase GlpK [Lachnospiraceae bacterium]|nr:glycerol kinase GlpK [Lachnospiraceae bacterium]